MAIIGKIREKSTLVLVIIGGAIIAFVLSDLFSSGSPGRSQGPLFLAEVKGETISPDEFEQELQEAYENYQARSEQEMDQRIKSQIRESVWNQMLSNIIIGEEREKLGVTVTSRELFDMVQGENPHPQVKQIFTNPETGEFNSSAVVQFLQNLDSGDPQAKEQWISFEKALKRNQQMQKYNNLIKKAVYLPSNLAKYQYADNNTKLNLKYVVQTYTSIPDSTVELTEKEIQAYYDEHQEEYEQEASRRLYYAYFPVRPSAADINAAEEWAQQTFERFKKAENDSIFVNANSDEDFDPTFYTKENLPLGVDTLLWKQEVGYTKAPFRIEDAYFMHKIKAEKMAPDSVQASHILISTQENSPEAAEQLADSLLNILKADLASIEELAPEYSDDVASAREGGDLGWFSEGMMVKPFNDAAFSMEVGEYRKVRSQFGFHIIQLTAKSEMRRKVQIATVRRVVTPSKETYAKAFNDANSFSIDVTDEESFNSLIREKNIQRRVAVLRENDNLIRGNEASRDLVRWAKEAKEGKVSEAYDIGDAFAVGFLQSVNEEGYAPLDKVRNRVEYMARLEKKADRFKQEMKGFASIGELAAELDLSIENAEGVTYSSPNIPNIGLEPKVVGKAMSLESGQMSIPIQGSNGVFVVLVENKIDAGNPNIAMTRGSNQRGVHTRIENGAVFEALKAKTEIEDNRAKYY